MSNVPGAGEGADETTGQIPAGGAPVGVLRVESSLVRWESGQAVFRVRLTRADGAIAEAHGAADESENVEYWSVAEERALARAAALLDSMAVVPSAGLQNPVPSPRIASPHPVPPAARNTTPRPETGRTGLNAPPGTPPATRRPAAGPANSSASPRPEREPPRNGSQPSTPPSTPADQKAAVPVVTDVDNTPKARPSTPSPSADPFEPDLPEEDPFDDNGRPATPAGTGAENVEKPSGHIRGEPGGGGQNPPDARAPRTQPIPAAIRCSHPGCSLPLTQGQVTLSSRKYGQPLCTRHLKERGG